MPSSGRILALAAPQTDALGWPSAVLLWSGYQVERAFTSEEAMRMMQRGRYDLLLFAYGSGPEDVRLAIEVLQEPEMRLPTLILLTDEDDFLTPPQAYYVPTAYLEPGFRQDELLTLVEQLKQYRQ